MLQLWQRPLMADKTHKYLAAHRKAHRLTGEELAEQLGTSKPTISRLERGEMGPKFDWWLAKLADYYKCTVASLQAAPDNDLLADSSQSGPEEEKKEPDMEPWEIALERIFEEVGHRAAAKRLDQFEAERRRKPRSRPSTRQRTS